MRSTREVALRNVRTLIEVAVQVEMCLQARRDEDAEAYFDVVVLRAKLLSDLLLQLRVESAS